MEIYAGGLNRLNFKGPPTASAATHTKGGIRPMYSSWSAAQSPVSSVYHRLRPGSPSLFMQFIVVFGGYPLYLSMVFPGSLGITV